MLPPPSQNYRQDLSLSSAAGLTVTTCARSKARPAIRGVPNLRQRAAPRHTSIELAELASVLARVGDPAGTPIVGIDAAGDTSVFMVPAQWKEFIIVSRGVVRVD